MLCYTEVGKSIRLGLDWEFVHHFRGVLGSTDEGHGFIVIVWCCGCVPTSGCECCYALKHF